VEPSANGVTVEEVTALYPCPVFGTTVPAAAKLLIANVVASAKINVFKIVIMIPDCVGSLINIKSEQLGCQSSS
jgi:hypothetical protein